MSTAERRVELGRIVGVHGVQGALRVESWTDPRARIFQYRPWTLVLPSGQDLTFDGACGHRHGKGLLAELPGITDRDQAQGLYGASIHAPRAALPPAAEGEYYWTDLEGLEVINLMGISLGRISHMLATGANDVLVVIDEQGCKRPVPFVQGQYVKDVDLEAGRILVDWDPDF